MNETQPVKQTKSNLLGPGPGRPKGSQNKTTRLLKDAILKAAEQAGNKIGDEGMISYLEAQASQNPGPFMSLLGKVLPMQIAGPDGEDGSTRPDFVYSNMTRSIYAPFNMNAKQRKAKEDGLDIC